MHTPATGRLIHIAAGYGPGTSPSSEVAMAHRTQHAPIGGAR